MHYLITYLNEIYIFISPRFRPDPSGRLSVKLGHPLVAIPEHETLDSKEVNAGYNWRSSSTFPCEAVEISQSYF